MAIQVCPSCQSAMKVVTRGEIVVDVCTSCRGIWLDPGELERIIADTRAEEAELGGPAAPPEAERRRGERRGDDRRGEDRRRGDRRGRDEYRDHSKRRKTRKKGFLSGLGDLIEDIFD